MATKTLSFKGAGKVSVPVADIVRSPKVQRQVALVRALFVKRVLIRGLQ